MEVEKAGGGQLAFKTAVKHGDLYEYEYEDTCETYAQLYDTADNKLPYVLHIDTRGVYKFGMHYHGQNDDGSWHDPIAELSGTGTEGTLIYPSDDDDATFYNAADDPIPEADEAKPRHLLADHYLSVGVLLRALY